MTDSTNQAPNEAIPELFMEEIQASRAFVFFDPANGINDPNDPNNSVTIRRPSFITISGMVAIELTAVIVELKLGHSSVWIEYEQINIAAPTALITFIGPEAPNFVRVRREGNGNIIAYAQFRLE